MFNNAPSTTNSLFSGATNTGPLAPPVLFKNNANTTSTPTTTTATTPTSTTPPTGLFGGAGSSTGGLFANAANTGGIFANNNSGSGFTNNAPNAFNNNQPNQPNQTINSPFGQPASSSPFGTATNTGSSPFGAQPATSSPFASQPATVPGASPFGGQPTATTNPASPFGGPPAASPFGTAQPASTTPLGQTAGSAGTGAPTTKTSLFGTATPATPGFGGSMGLSFGSSTATTNPLFGGQKEPAKGFTLGNNGGNLNLTSNPSFGEINKEPAKSDAQFQQQSANNQATTTNNQTNTANTNAPMFGGTNTQSSVPMFGNNNQQPTTTTTPTPATIGTTANKTNTPLFANPTGTTPTLTTPTGTTPTGTTPTLTTPATTTPTPTATQANPLFNQNQTTAPNTAGSTQGFPMFGNKPTPTTTPTTTTPTTTNPINPMTQTVSKGMEETKVVGNGAVQNPGNQETQPSLDLRQQRILNEYEKSNKTANEYMNEWKRLLKDNYNELALQCKKMADLDTDRRENYKIISNFRQLEPVISHSKENTERMLTNIEKRQSEILKILHQIKEDLGIDVNQRYARKHPVAVQIQSCKSIRKMVNAEDEKYTSEQDIDPSNMQLRNIFCNLDSVENEIRRLNHVLDHYFGRQSY